MTPEKVVFWPGYPRENGGHSGSRRPQHKAMLNHHFSWENSRTFGWAMFNRYVTVISRGYICWIQRTKWGLHRSHHISIYIYIHICIYTCIYVYHISFAGIFDDVTHLFHDAWNLTTSDNGPSEELSPPQSPTSGGFPMWPWVKTLAPFGKIKIDGKWMWITTQIWHHRFWPMAMWKGLERAPFENSGVKPQKLGDPMVPQWVTIENHEPNHLRMGIAARTQARPRIFVSDRSSSTQPWALVKIRISLLILTTYLQLGTWKLCMWIIACHWIPGSIVTRKIPMGYLGTPKKLTDFDGHPSESANIEQTPLSESSYDVLSYACL